MWREGEGKRPRAAKTPFLPETYFAGNLFAENLEAGSAECSFR
jgi:hypothetical protein